MKKTRIFFEQRASELEPNRQSPTADFLQTKNACILYRINLYFVSFKKR